MTSLTPRSLFRKALVAARIDPRTFNAVAQSGHFLAGCLAVFAPIVLIGPAWRWWGALGIVLWAAGKEFLWDPRYESAEVRGSSVEDFCYYIFGAALSLGIVQWL